MLWDTLLARLAPEQVVVVMRHEMGHFVHGHSWVMLGPLCALVVATLHAVHRSLGLLIAHFGHRFSFSEPADIASLPLLALLCSTFFLLTQPIDLAYSQQIEREADRFAFLITRDNRATATAFMLLQDHNRVHPRPRTRYMLWRSRHPAIAERVELANHDRPWERGEPLVYGDHFRDGG